MLFLIYFPPSTPIIVYSFADFIGNVHSSNTHHVGEVVASIFSLLLEIDRERDTDAIVVTPYRHSAVVPLRTYVCGEMSIVPLSIVLSCLVNTRVYDFATRIEREREGTL